MEQHNKEELMLYTNDLCRLASKAHAWGLRQEEVARFQSDIDAIKHLATTASTSAGSTSPFSSSPPATATAASSGFLSSTLTALSTNASSFLGGQQHSATTDAAEADLMVMSGVADLHKAVGSPSGPKRRNRGKNLPKDIKRACAICKAEKTSQWRSGADGRPTMKQHRQYLASQQLSSSASSSSGEAVAEQPPTGASAQTTTTTAYSHEVLLQHLIRLRHQQQQHLSKTDSTDSIGSEDDSPSPACSSSPADAMPRRSSIYSLLN
ncbi:uncharacterized protein ACA1_065400 [Acanthamoeba castellanii str. Neff]|uniref:GATA-type domain-containing protein n=1 Tax=Acanthamoeba castellanii (strain ATCC 30010 / Neff) TaxID=1257118 RepID=L8H033_ACACF|nr:uncharacterized protein ACA1_065400 [Acanthamoeba castellanii str. Neff]ELR17741.1 hypothetical protein ACA1_065400 [Acanthamoeba castellanii str. Neff]